MSISDSPQYRKKGGEHCGGQGLPRGGRRQRSWWLPGQARRLRREGDQGSAEQPLISVAMTLKNPRRTWNF